MKNQIKQTMKDNHGVALTMVMVLIFIMTFMGGTMYAYTMQSIKVLDFGTSRQKAEYIARSGIEASVFMYQDAMLKNDAEHSGIQKFLTKTDKTDTNAGENIVTNWVYLEKDGKTYVDGGELAEPTLPAGSSEEDYIGYFRVKIENGTQEYFMPGKTEATTQYVKHFISEGHCKNMKALKKAYIIPLVDVSSRGWINENGEINLQKVYEANQKDTQTMLEKTTVSIECGWLDDFIEASKGKMNKLSEYLEKKYPFLKGHTIKYPGSPRLKALDVYFGATAGNMELKAPKNADGKRLPIHFAKDYEDHGAGFISMGNLFIRGDIDTESIETRFNSLILRGNQIVIDGEINMYVYDPQTNNLNSFSALTSGLTAKIARNYRFSTVILGTPSDKVTTVTDPMPKANGGVGTCGQVFFGGDVYVNFITRNGQTKRYKVFRAGETYYFDGDFEVSTGLDKNGHKTDDLSQIVKAPLGIDLLKYFLDTEIEKQRYSPQVLQQFERTRKFYYNKSGKQDTYSAGLTKGKPASMRKIDIQKNPKWDKITDTVIPSPGEGSYIIWE